MKCFLLFHHEVGAARGIIHDMTRHAFAQRAVPFRPARTSRQPMRSKSSLDVSASLRGNVVMGANSHTDFGRTVAGQYCTVRLPSRCNLQGPALGRIWRIRRRDAELRQSSSRFASREGVPARLPPPCSIRLLFQLELAQTPAAASQICGCVRDQPPLAHAVRGQPHAIATTVEVVESDEYFESQSTGLFKTSVANLSLLFSHQFDPALKLVEAEAFRPDNMFAVGQNQPGQGAHTPRTPCLLLVDPHRAHRHGDTSLLEPLT